MRIRPTDRDADVSLSTGCRRSRQQLEGGFPSRSAPLPPYEVRVDFRSVAEQVAFKINSQDFRCGGSWCKMLVINLGMRGLHCGWWMTTACCW